MNHEIKKELKETLAQIATGASFVVGSVAVIGAMGYGLFVLMGNL